MDLNMPVMTGEESTTAILNSCKRQASSVDFPNVIAVTSQTNIKVKENCLKLGFKDVYNKPLSLDKLLEIMARWFDQG